MFAAVTSDILAPVVLAIGTTPAEARANAALAMRETGRVGEHHERIEVYPITDVEAAVVRSRGVVAWPIEVDDDLLACREKGPVGPSEPCSAHGR